MVTQSDIARKCGIDISSVNKILHQLPGASFNKKTIQNVFRVAKELGYDLGRLKHPHRRRHPRKAVEVAIQMTIYRTDGTVFSSGQATLKEVSLSGAILSAMVQSHPAVPLAPHTIGIHPLSGEMKGVEVRGRLVRFFHEDNGLSLAIEFLTTESAARKWLRKIS